MRKYILAGSVGAAVAALATTWLIAQPVVQVALNGTECWNAGQGPGGPSVGALCSNATAGRAPDVAVTISASFTVGAAGTTGVSVTTQPLQSGGFLLVTAQPSAATVTLPPNPVSDGALVAYCNVTNAAFSTAVVAYAANTNQTLATGVPAMTAQGARTCNKVMFNAAAATWYGVN
jgi:hypothetical protein